MKKNIWRVISGIGLYLLATGISAWSFGAFGFNREPAVPPAVQTGGGPLVIDPSEPRDQECPINGGMFTRTEKKFWEGNRPILVMIENHLEARPQSGIAMADVVYEAVAEGGITRFMGVFYCASSASQGKVAPVRSSRIYFVNIAAEYNNPIYTHVGGGNCSRDEGTGECTSDKKAWALEELVKLGWRRAKGNDFDTLSDIGKPVLYRDGSRLGAGRVLAVEHTMVGSLANIWKEAEKRGFTGKTPGGKDWITGFRKWMFAEGESEAERGDVNAIGFDFWNGYGDYRVRWEYDRSANVYRRLTGGQPHLDLENNFQLAAGNVVIQFVKQEGPLDEHKHMYYEVKGNGKALIFQNGKVTEGTWEKPSQKERTIFYGQGKNEINFVRSGPIWIEIVPAGNTIEY